MQVIRTFNLENEREYEYKQVTHRDFLSDSEEKIVNACEEFFAVFHALDLKEKEIILSALKVITEQYIVS